MPANLTQQYLKAEEAYRRAATPDEELKCLQAMLQEIPKHKGTDHLQASLKTKISKLKKDITSDKKSGQKSRGLRIPRQGAGTAILLGGPNAGKSQFLATMTGATPEVAQYPFTTHQPMPGMMPWEDVVVQLIDTPPITSDFIEAYIYGLIRSAELVLLILDLGDDDGVTRCLEVIEKLNETKTRLGSESCLDESDVGLSFTQTLLIPNKIDLPGANDRLELFHEMSPISLPEFPISATEEIGLEPLRNEIYRRMDVVRAYTKLPSAKEPDMGRPFTVRRGDTLLDLAPQVHKDYAKGLKFARVWGSAVHDGTIVKGDYEINDRDIVELHL
jgi:ribosome-interacting GTPase 1